MGELPTGEYTLHLAVLNEANEALAEQSKRFYVINPDVAQPQRNVAIADDDELFYRAMGEEEIALNVDHARVVATGAERDRIAGAPDGRRAPRAFCSASGETATERPRRATRGASSTSA